MAKIRTRWSVIILCLLGVLFVILRYSHYNVRGRVVDAETGEPIEGASIAIEWIGKEPISYIVTYSGGNYTLEKAQTKSDKNGYFRIPKYWLKSFYMGVYKKGYVCFSNKRIFLKGQRGLYENNRTKNRKWFHVWNGMVIKLEPFTDEYDRPTHAAFVRVVDQESGRLEGIGEEIKLYKKHFIDPKKGRK